MVSTVIEVHIMIELSDIPQKPNFRELIAFKSHIRKSGEGSQPPD